MLTLRGTVEPHMYFGKRAPNWLKFPVGKDCSHSETMLPVYSSDMLHAAGKCGWPSVWHELGHPESEVVRYGNENGDLVDKHDIN